MSEPVNLQSVAQRTQRGGGYSTASAEQPTAERHLPAIDLLDLLAKPVPPRLWHVDGLIPANTVTLLYGDGATGKSLIALQLAVATVMGGLWLGRPVREGPCLFITAEDDEDEVHRRSADIQANGEVRLTRQGLHIVSLVGEDAILAAPEGPTSIITATALFRAVERHVQALRPTLLNLDTLADLFGGEENARAQARQFIGLLRGLAHRYELTVLLLAHPSLTGMSSGSGLSGSTAWNNSVRSRLLFERVIDADKKEADADVRRLVVKKANYAEVGSEIKVRWSDGVFLPIDAGTDQSSFFTKRAAEHRADEVFLALLSHRAAEGRDVTDKTGTTYAPASFAADPRAEGITSKGFAAAMARLFAAGRIRVETFGPMSRRRTRLTPVPPLG